MGFFFLRKFYCRKQLTARGRVAEGGYLVSFIHRPYDDDYDECPSGRRRRGGGATEPAAALGNFLCIYGNGCEDFRDQDDDDSVFFR